MLSTLSYRLDGYKRPRMPATLFATGKRRQESDMANAKRFSEQIVMITGAAGGLGAAMARAFARDGATVVVTGRKEAQGLALAKEIGARALFTRLDVTDEASW